MNLTGRTTIITGGTKGIGLEIAKAFRGAGADVVVGARTLPEGFEQRYPDLMYQKTDVRNYDEVEALTTFAVQKTGRLDIMINNAGISIWKSLDHVDDAFFSTMIDTNLKGCFWGCKAAAKHFTHPGVIINLGSLAGKRGSKNNSVYCASKFGVIGLTQALAKELGGKNIRVNSVCPVYIKTDMLMANLSGDHPEIRDEDPGAFLKRFGENNAALKRIPLAAEIANACLFLASPLASAVTGQNINVDCGVLPQ